MTRFALLVGLATQALLWVPTTHAQVPEGKVKTAIVMAIGRFMEWPDRLRPEKDEGIFYVGLLADSKYAADFTGFNDQLLDGRSIKVIQVRSDMSREDLKRCDLIFGQNNAALKLIQKKIETAPVLIVADSPPKTKPALYPGVSLLVKDNRLVFHLNLPTLQKSDIRPTAQLLKMADRVNR